MNGICGEDKAIPLPVIAYSKEDGLVTGMSSMFKHGHKAKNGFVMNHGRLMKVQDPSFPKGEVEVHGIHQKEYEVVQKDDEGKALKDDEGKMLTEVKTKYMAFSEWKRIRGFQSRIY